MNVWKEHEDAFRGYVEPLQKLEEAFNAAGLRVKFHLFVHPCGDKAVEVTNGYSSQKFIFIEADSPAMAVKNVAKGVKIC